MCMKNVNATMLMCSEFGKSGNSVSSLINLFDSIIPTKDEEGNYYIENLNIVLNLMIVFDERFDEPEKCFAVGQKYEIMLRITHVGSGLGTTLFNFDLCVENNDLKTWCKSFYESKRIVSVPRLYIPKGLGNYALKLLIRAKSEENNPWHVQTIHSLVIGDSCAE